MGHIYYRAQYGYDWRTFEPTFYGADEKHRIRRQTAFSADRMRPKAEFVGDGRANPAGIPFLYMATTPTTAMAEVRPWLGCTVSLAHFELLRNVFLVDCSGDARRKHSPSDSYRARAVHLSAGEKETAVWGEISDAFSKPVGSDVRRSSYVPTQVLAEAFRKHEYDGIVYSSLLEEGGKNVVLFDPRVAEPRMLQLFETRALSFEFVPREAAWPAQRKDGSELVSRRAITAE
jgi:RES domain-containing protein